MVWRSSTLQLVAETCPKALDFLEADAPYNRDIFSVGTAAHAALEDCGKKTVEIGRWLSPEESAEVMQGTCEKLISEGREFAGKKEPPLPPDKVWAGRDLALRYQKDSPLSPKYTYEKTLGVTKDFLPCPSKGAWLACRIDAFGTFEPGDDGGWFDESNLAVGPILRVRDYKSKWTADKSELNTTQRKIQAVIGWAHFQDGHEALELEVVNFRTGRSHKIMILPRTPEGAEVLERWKEDIRSEIKALEGPRIASPGACCMGCPYINQCADALAYLPRVFGSANPEEMAKSYAVNLAVAASMEQALRRATADEPIAIPGGFIGAKLGSERKLTDEAYRMLAEFWIAQAKPSSFEQLTAMLPGLLRSLKIGTGNARALTEKYLQKDSEKIIQREAFLESVTKVRLKPKWGLHRGEAGLDGDSESE